MFLVTLYNRIVLKMFVGKKEQVTVLPVLSGFMISDDTSKLCPAQGKRFMVTFVLQT